jgi:predicted component of type VI protein secretion system
MPPQLVALTEGPSLLLDKPILLIGRHQECDIQLPSRKISRRHCCIAQVDKHLVVRDLSSTNGIRINGKRVLEGKLDPGDELTIGNYRYRIHWGDALPAAKPDGDSQTVKADEVPAPARDEDDELESCDEPVALPDPDAVEGPIVPDQLELAPISDLKRRPQPPRSPGEPAA